MPDLMLTPFLKKGWVDRSVIVGAPAEFDFLAALRAASDISIASAFGHMSGWRKIKDALVSSSAQTIRLLLGQSFFQTEPELLLLLRDLQSSSQTPRFEVKLAPASATFHPKVWIIGHPKRPVCVVGSGNLSSGGLLGNVECGVLTSHDNHVSALQNWFDQVWTLTAPLERTLDQYLSKYRKIEAARKSVKAIIEAETHEQVRKEATWRQRRAVELAGKYWESEEGVHAVESREGAIASMRDSLDYPRFQFGPAQWSTFLRIPELGRIRLGHEKRTLSDLSKLRIALARIATQSLPVEQSLDLLQEIGGVGRNLATKLLAMCQPEKFVVLNKPVERALRALGYEVDPRRSITGRGYRQFLEELTDFIRASDAAGLKAAPALDAFFYAYNRGLPRD
jgi:HKD family nuclease